MGLISPGSGCHRDAETIHTGDNPAAKHFLCQALGQNQKELIRVVVVTGRKEIQDKPAYNPLTHPWVPYIRCRVQG